MAYTPKQPSPRRPDRKTLQLCKQVERALAFALSETADDRLLDAYVDSVQPHPDANHMLISVTGGTPADTLAALHEHTGRLRTEVAYAISRRKAPELIFQIV
jgi:ribosome-binding factor A